MWDEARETWTIPGLNTRRGNRLRERSTSGGSARRPETELSRELKMVDSNPRWRSEDIVDLDLAMPVRNTPASRDDPNTLKAIAAILAMDMGDEVEELPLNEIRTNRQKKFLKAEVSHFSVCYVPCSTMCNYNSTLTTTTSPSHRLPQSRDRGAGKTNPRVVQQQHSKHRNLNHTLSFTHYFRLLSGKIFSFASKGGRLFVSIG